ncbi:MAG: phosphoribosylamine--glycine ligase [Ignavibacteriaceae bacterium]
MKVAIVGTGGREHCLGYRISSSEECEKIYFLSGNAGTTAVGENVEVNQGDNQAILKFCQEKSIDFVIIGPEKPLVDGLSDMLRENNITVFGPSGNAARIESEKSYAKMIMKKYSVPTAEYKEYSRSERGEVLEYLKKVSYPVVIKADGLAAGKGVLICGSYAESESAINDIFQSNIFGSSGDKVIIEEFLKGEEATIFAITDGEGYVTLPAAQDHKRIGDGDTGKNTGGMGAYAPAPVITPLLLEEIKRNIIEPTLKGLRAENNPFTGCLYCGLMITQEGPKVIEFNCRFGDPETQVVLPIVEGDFLRLLYSAATGKLDAKSVWYGSKSAVCVVAASQGYPDKYESGFPIKGLGTLDSEKYYAFHSGTKSMNNVVLTNGGRVLGLTAILGENNLRLAIKEAYSGIEKIDFKNIYYRKDIGSKALK